MDIGNPQNTDVENQKASDHPKEEADKKLGGEPDRTPILEVDRGFS